MDTLGRIILSIIERLSSFKDKMYSTIIGWCIRKCPLYRGVLYQSRGYIEACSGKGEDIIDTSSLLLLLASVAPSLFHSMAS